MLKQDIRILIVEDDQIFGRSIEEAFKRAGYPCRLTSSVEEAETAFKINEYRVVILDCMLPRINGVQLAELFRATAGDNFKILLISGIFKDRSFINDALRKTKALGFFSKPFESMTLVEAVEAAFEEFVEEERDPLFLLLTKESHSLKERLEALEETESIHGFDLPFVYSLLIGTTVSGDLNIITADGEASSVTFSEGKITQVNIQDKTSYFGVLLVEHGFTSNEEVTTGLSGTSEKPIGERLVEANALSPHAISLVRREQSAIRLSKTIQDTSVQIAFMNTPSMTVKKRLIRRL
ncbi:MAG: response regulator transcription factor [Bdellovibrionales bacterium]|nr:response regulator transcription factor [Bdellovibrionales bacterium]